MERFAEEPALSAGEEMVTERWRIELLAELRASRGPHTITRFYTHKIGGLLAYLAFYRERAHPREELIERFWTDADVDQGRTSLRTALASLRRQLEPPDTSSGSVLIADRATVRLCPDAFTTDVADFERGVWEADHASSPEEQGRRLARSIVLYAGELLPGHYEDWVLRERDRLAETHANALRRLAEVREVLGDHQGAIECMRTVVHANALDEATHVSLIRLYVASGQSTMAQRQYHEMERILREELDTRPAQSFQAIVADARARARERPSRSPAVSEPDTAHPESPIPSLSYPASPPAPTIPSLLLPPLPVPFTRFFGRKEEIAQIQERLAEPDARLVTLTGLGGSGKTRLALEVAHRAREVGHGTVGFVSLVDVDSPELIGHALCSALRLDTTSRVDLLEQAALALRDRPTLLVLDNFEQLVHAGEGGGVVLRKLLERAPMLTCLVTSRQRLGITGEWEFPVAPLPTPSAPGTPARLMEFACVQLFVNRMQAMRPDFQVTETNAQSVAQLCHNLEGIPLALELAAAHGQVLTPAQMLRQVADRFGFLVGRHRDTAERHRTLRAALEWTYQSLDARHQQLFAGLSVFRGGWTLQAVEAVCQEASAVDYLMDLRDASLVQTEEQAGEMRFRMLETVREYAAERLAEGGLEPQTRQRHLEHFLEVAQEHDWASTGQAYILWRERVREDYENIRAAIAWSLRNEPIDLPGLTDESASSALGLPSRAEVALRLTGALGAYWILSSRYREGLDWLRKALTFARESSAPIPDAVWAVTRMSAGYVAFVSGEFEPARRDAEEGLAFARMAGDRIQQIQCLAILAQLPAGPDDPDRPLRLLDEAQSIAIETGNPRKIAFILYVLGRVSYLRGDEARACVALEQSLDVSRTTKDGNMIAHAAANLASLALCRGDVDQARALSAEALESYNSRGFRDTRGFNGIVANVQAFIAIHAGDYAPARAVFLRALSTAIEVGDRQAGPNILVGLAAAAGAEGEWLYAAALLGAAERSCEEIGVPLEPMERSFYENTLHQIRERLTPDQLAAARAQGRAWSAQDTYRNLVQGET